jgi:cobalt/nickel transport system permease protein
MLQEGFTEGDSLLHQLDPRAKILCVFLFSIIVAVCQRSTVLVLALILSLCLAFAARVTGWRLAKRLIPVNLFIIFLWAFLPFTVAGDPVFTAGPLTATKQGLWYAVRITLKSNAIVIALVSLITSTSILTLGHALHEMKVPQKIIHLFFFTYRYIFVIYREYVRLVEAMKVRGFQPRTNLHTYKTFAYMVGMLLVRSSERAERVHNAMVCRGFSGKFYSFSEFTLKRSDLLWVGLMVVCVLFLGVLEWTKMA